MKTIVLFRIQNGVVFAVFPELAASSTTIEMCITYQLIGQHGHGDIGCMIKHSKPATKAEYSSLEIELTAQGYELDVRKRTPTSARQTRLDQVRYAYS